MTGGDFSLLRYLKAVAGVIAVASGIAACGNPPYPRGSIDQLFANTTAPVISQQVIDGHIINMARIDSPVSVTQGANKTMLLFIHGSPGDWKAWSRF
jgi:pimeloyl-ACP methyl ester carboxylesterase